MKIKTRPLDGTKQFRLNHFVLEILNGIVNKSVETLISYFFVGWIWSDLMPFDISCEVFLRLMIQKKKRTEMKCTVCMYYQKPKHSFTERFKFMPYVSSRKCISDVSRSVLVWPNRYVYMFIWMIRRSKWIEVKLIWNVPFMSTVDDQTIICFIGLTRRILENDKRK